MEISKSAINRQKKLDGGIGESFKEYKARILKEQEAIKQAEINVMIENADLINAKKNRQRERLQENEKRMTYEDRAMVIGLTEALAEVVEESLLLDVEEYEKINENYKDFIRTTLRSFLENATINENVTNEYTLALIESVNKAKPSIDVGIYLTESELLEQFKKEEEVDPNDEIDEFGNPTYNDSIKAIDKLSCNVMDKVAERIDSDRLETEAINNQLNAMVTPLGESSLLVRNEKPNKTVLEVLAMNEANEMLAESKEYNSDLALANAITYITILETLDTTGLVKIGKEGYNSILEAAGERNQEKRVAKHSHAINILEKEQEETIKDKVALIEGQVASARHAGFKSFSEYKKEKGIISYTPTNLNETVEIKYDYVDKNGNKVLTEDVKRDAIRKGFDLDLNDFANVCRILGYRKL